MLNGNRIKSNRGRSPRDLYITPPEIALEAIKIFCIDEYFPVPIGNVLDAGCGTGVWGKCLDKAVLSHNVLGIDIHPIVTIENEDYYEDVISADFIKFKPKITRYNLIIGNPPYSLAEEFIRHSFELLESGGYIYFLLRLSFLEGIARGKGLFKEFPMKKVYICSRRPSFFSTNGKHTTDTLAYAMFLWQKNYQGKTELDFLDWEYSK